MVHQSDCDTAGVLKPFGVTLRSARQLVEVIVGRGQPPSDGDATPFTPRAEKVLEFARGEAFQLGHDHADSEHLLMVWGSRIVPPSVTCGFAPPMHTRWSGLRGSVDA
jgi:ATP-dependent Clp protease ATP-binding subunit ClpC